MSKLNELKRESDRILEIFLNAKENFTYCYYLYNPNSTEEVICANNDKELRFIRHSLWRLTIIEVAKLISNKKSDKFKLLPFLSKLKSDGYYRSLKISKTKISIWEKSILNNEKLIANVLTLRDKIYAHTDPNKDEYKKIEIFFNQIEELFNSIEVMLNEFYSEILGTSLLLNTSYLDKKEFQLVKILAQEQSRKIENIKKYLKK